ncbi:Pycsar system effector family protein [Halopseudomonas bauzanensis]|uniref:Pycsar system effector family protein n=1 Tax=Halopseudomonas bauzanensis TaxID=653930 RepID=UPI002555BFD8|nr:Pycsar system effector family protein [Halopseudomonas bauzanensis]
MDEKLKEIFSNINDWLKFAEAKSATLIACNGALIFGISRLISSFDLKGIYLLYFILISALCILSIAICFLSIIPSLSMPWEKKPSGTSDEDNLMYFSDIAKYTPLAYLNALKDKLELNDSAFTGYQRDISNQIIINSVIADKKYRAFQKAIWLTLAAVISPVLALLVFLFKVK